MSALGPVRWHCTMSLDGYVAGPDDDMSFIESATGLEGIAARYVAETGAILVGRRAYDAYVDDPDMQYYGGEWAGRQFVLTHHPDDAVARPGWTVLSGDLADVIETVREAAGGKAVEIISASIASQALDAGLVDEVHVHIAPVILGQGVRFFDRAGPGPRIQLERLDGSDPQAIASLTYRIRAVS